MKKVKKSYHINEPEEVNLKEIMVSLLFETFKRYGCINKGCILSSGFLSTQTVPFEESWIFENIKRELNSGHKY